MSVVKIWIISFCHFLCSLTLINIVCCMWEHLLVVLCTYERYVGLGSYGMCNDTKVIVNNLFSIRQLQQSVLAEILISCRLVVMVYSRKSKFLVDL